MADNNTEHQEFERRRDLYIAAKYAPGDYWCRCVTCEKRFEGDKRAVRCFDCATEIIASAHAVG